MDIKVHVLTRCETCDGEAYLPAGEAVSHTGESYRRYEPCTACQGSGRQTRWISLEELAELLERATTGMPEPDWLELAHHQPVSQYADSREAAGI